MRRTAATDDSQAVSLFPFLAVLLSTMGALLVVLVVMARQARLQAADADAPRAAEATPDQAEDQSADEGTSSEDMEELRAAAERLQAVRDVGLEELEKSRQRLRYADHHLLQLQDQVARLYEELHALEERDSQRVDDQEQAERELSRLRDLIRDTEERIDEQRRRATEAPKSYAIIPYKGPHGTTRRPLYIECRRDSVVLQPEGIELAPRDFQGPLGPGNPLAAALRAAEEYYVNESGIGAAGAPAPQPYPLVLVRPDGIAAYYYVRRALEAWSSDFGYELLDGDWKLEFPLPNPQVANIQQRAINLARARQQALALAAPRRFGGSGGMAVDRDGSEGDPYGGFAAGLPEGIGGTDGDWGEGGDGAGGSTSGRYAASPARKAVPSHAPASETATAGALAGQPEGRAPANVQAAEDRTSPADLNRAESGTATGPAHRTGQFHPASTGRGSDRYSLRGPTTSQAAGGDQGQPGGSAMGTSETGSPAGAPSSRVAAAGQSGGSIGSGTSMQPMAEIRGAGWALPEASLSAAPVRRTVHVVVRNDRLAILPEHGLVGCAVPIAGSIGAAVDPFVEAVQDRIAGWGIAGRGLYWQPILVLQPGPDGVSNADALRQLLTGSGLEVAP